MVVFVDKDDAGRVGLDLVAVHQRIAHDDDLVARGHAARRRAVEADHATAALACDDVGLEALAVVDVDDLHLLVLADARSLHQVLVDGDAANVVKLGLDDGCAVDLALQHVQKHGF